MPSYDLRVLGENNHLFAITSDRNLSLNIALFSDVHLDNEKCDRGLLAEHLQEAKHRDALVMLNGDTLDAMGGKSDVRSCKKALREAHITDEYYFDNICDDAVQFFDKHCGDRLAWVGLGNHETKIGKHFEFNLLRMFLDRYNATVAPECHAVMGSYRSYINVQFRRKQSGSSTFSILAHHGYGGGGASGKGAQHFHNMMGGLGGGIDMIWQGHVHQQYAIKMPVIELDHNFNEIKSARWGVRTSTYKEEIMSDHSHGRGWAIERGMNVKPMGGAFLRLDWTPKHSTIKSTVELMNE